MPEPLPELATSRALAALEAEGISSDSESELDPLDEVKAWEGDGDTINEHYAMWEYVKHRAHFLSKVFDWKHPESKHLPSNHPKARRNQHFFPTARDDAQTIFDPYDKVLSVQEIRTLEFQLKVFPLLPLPTTTNHWDDSENSLNARIANGEVSKTATTSKTGAANSANSLPGANQTTSAYLAKMGEDAKDKRLSLSDTSTMTPADPNTFARSTDSNGKYPPTSDMYYKEAGRKLSESDFVREFILPRLGKAAYEAQLSTVDARAQSPPADQEDPLSAAKTVAAARLANRPGDFAMAQGAVYNSPMYPAVKVKSRLPVQTSDAVQTTESAEKDKFITEDTDDELPPPKKTKLSKAAGMPDPLAGMPFEKHASAMPKATLAYVNTNELVDEKLADKNLEDVVSGASLPMSMAEAKEAADVRLVQLKAGLGAKIAIEASGNEDFMPEFFSTANFTVGEEDDFVRCICGVTVEDFEEMIQCNGKNCGVWQHTKCMHAGVPKGLKGEYYCHMCDPFTHRRAVAEMRRNRPL